MMVASLSWYGDPVTHNHLSTPEDRAAVFALFDAGNGSINGAGLADSLRTLGFTVCSALIVLRCCI